MKVGLNQPIMREVLEKIMNSRESDVLTESVTEDSADDQQVTKKLPVRQARKGLKRLKGKTGSRAVNQRVVKSKASAVVASLTSEGRSGGSGQGDGATLAGGEKENLIPPMLLAGLTKTATKLKKTAGTLADTKLEMEIISQCGSGGHGDYRPSRTNMTKMELEGQRGRVQSSHCAGIGPHGRSSRWLCGDVEGEELRERAPDGLEREASHAGISGTSYGEF